MTARLLALRARGGRAARGPSEELESDTSLAIFRCASVAD